MSKNDLSHLILNAETAIYHLNLRPEDLADNIILVGDPDRVAFISSQMDSVELKRQNREYVTHTGVYHGKRITIMSSGIGVGNIDIVMNELDALKNIDFSTGKPKGELTRLNIVRIGTSGTIQEDIEPGQFVISEFTIGFDNLLDYYQYKPTQEEAELKAAISQLLPHDLGFYFFAGDKSLMQAFPEDVVRGITCVAPGFYAPQQRQLRAPLRYPDLIERLMPFRQDERRITNFEMEASAIYGLGSIMGHRCCTIDLILANRPKNTFLHDYKPRMKDLAGLVLEVLAGI